jgi:hypothetical protein
MFIRSQAPESGNPLSLASVRFQLRNEDSINNVPLHRAEELFRQICAINNPLILTHQNPDMDALTAAVIVAVIKRLDQISQYHEDDPVLEKSLSPFCEHIHDIAHSFFDSARSILGLHSRSEHYAELVLSQKYDSWCQEKGIKPVHIYFTGTMPEVVLKQLQDIGITPCALESLNKSGQDSIVAEQPLILVDIAYSETNKHCTGGLSLNGYAVNVDHHVEDVSAVYENQFFFREAGSSTAIMLASLELFCEERGVSYPAIIRKISDLIIPAVAIDGDIPLDLVSAIFDARNVPSNFFDLFDLDIIQFFSDPALKVPLAGGTLEDIVQLYDFPRVAAAILKDMYRLGFNTSQKEAILNLSITNHPAYEELYKRANRSCKEVHLGNGIQLVILSIGELTEDLTSQSDCIATQHLVGASTIVLSNQLRLFDLIGLNDQNKDIPKRIVAVFGIEVDHEGNPIQRISLRCSSEVCKQGIDIGNIVEQIVKLINNSNNSQGKQIASGGGDGRRGCFTYNIEKASIDHLAKPDSCSEGTWSIIRELFIYTEEICSAT